MQGKFHHINRSLKRYPFEKSRQVVFIRKFDVFAFCQGIWETLKCDNTNATSF